MRTTIDIPEDELREAMRHLGAKTKKEAVVTAIVEFNRCRRIDWLIEQLGTLDEVMTREELVKLREAGPLRSAEDLADRAADDRRGVDDVGAGLG